MSTVTIAPGTDKTITVKTSDTSLVDAKGNTGTSTMYHNSTVYDTSNKFSRDSYVVITTIGQLNKPLGLFWSAANPGTAKWGEVNHASGYSVELYKDGNSTPVSTQGTTATIRQFDFSTAIQSNGAGKIYV